MRAYSRDQVLAAFAAVARPIIRQSFIDRSCIVSTKIAIDVLRHFRIAARPLAVKLQINTYGMLEAMNDPAFPTMTEEEQVNYLNGVGAHATWVGYEDPDAPAPGWPGHLVCIVGGRYLLDASSDQASRPQHGWTMPPVLVGKVAADFRDAPTSYDLQGNAIATYLPQKHDHSYTNAPDWRPTTESVGTTRLIVEAMVRRMYGRGNQRPDVLQRLTEEAA